MPEGTTIPAAMVAIHPIRLMDSALDFTEAPSIHRIFPILTILPITRIALITVTTAPTTADTATTEGAIIMAVMDITEDTHDTVARTLIVRTDAIRAFKNPTLTETAVPV